jgi:hypothetical protein
VWSNTSDQPDYYPCGTIIIVPSSSIKIPSPIKKKLNTTLCVCVYDYHVMLTFGCNTRFAVDETICRDTAFTVS